MHCHPVHLDSGLYVSIPTALTVVFFCSSRVILFFIFLLFNYHFSCLVESLKWLCACDRTRVAVENSTDLFFLSRLKINVHILDMEAGSVWNLKRYNKIL